jgi:hypothetical protein
VSDSSNKSTVAGANRSYYGNTAAHTGTLATTAALSTVSWACCTVVDSTNCAGKTDTNKLFDGTWWAWYLKQKAGTSGVLGTAYETDSAVSFKYHVDLLMASLNQVNGTTTSDYCSAHKIVLTTEY